MDFHDGVLVITYSKFNKSRELPLHPSAVRALRDYAKLRDELCGEPKSANFFVSTLGTCLVYVTVQQVFSRLVRAAGLRARSASCRPGSTTRATHLPPRRFLGWYRSGVNVEAQLPLLSTYLGHTNPAHTFWYYSDSRVIPIPAPLPA